MKSTRSSILLCLLFLAAASATPGAHAAPPVSQTAVEGDAGSRVIIGRSSDSGVVFVYGDGGRWETTGTMVWLPLSLFDAFCAHTVRALELVPPSAPPDTEQTIFAAPVVVKDGVGGVVMVSLARLAGGEPRLTIFAKRGDEQWDSRATFSGGHLQALLQSVRNVVR